MSSVYPFQHFIGVDVGKKTLEVSDPRWQNGKSHDIANTDKAIAKFVDKHVQNDTLVVMEGTGGYERTLRLVLAERGVAYTVANAKQVRDFCKGCGQLAKTDEIDARMLSFFGATVKPHPSQIKSEDEERLSDFRCRRNQLLNLINQESNRLEQAYDKEVIKLIKKVVETLKKQLKRVNERIEQLIAQNQELSHKAAILKSAPGVGKVTAGSLIAELPELGWMNREGIALLVGVAPMNHDSAGKEKKRRIQGGRSSVRKALYMATLVATRHNEVIKRFYDRLLDGGKPKMVALTAAMRKFLTILNTMVKNNQKWNPQGQFSTQNTALAVDAPST